MQIYMVGGAVRDALLGLPVQDHDWVVVGATPEQMVQAGFVPVGKDFPVFLHPVTKEEVALARTERKTAPGYHGFAFHAAPDVSLEDDLSRRDLTINAIAVQAINTPADARFQGPLGGSNDWAIDVGRIKDRLIDPHGGLRDLQAKVLRHVSSAFAEDPVRILRLARFAARFADFTVAPETMTLMRQMVASGEVDALVPERVWQELAKGLMEAQPSRMFEVLRECGALARLLPELDQLWGVPQRADYHPEIDTGVHVMMVLDMSAQLQGALPVRFACLCHDLGKGTTPADVLPRHIGHEERSVRLLQEVSARLRVPTECRQLAEVVAREHGNIHRSLDFAAAAVVRLLQRCDAFRKPQRFDEVLLACECDARGRLGFQDAAYPQRPRLLQALQAAQSVATYLIAEQAMNTPAKVEFEGQAADKPKGKDIGELILKARVAAVAALPAFKAQFDAS
ncbi:MAG: multifunctional CCA addition/repair protein [Burkholderiaceae bacterium]|nr:multifunctional CCA addition/repair protein [Burkholderiaceae bacterium]